jgi:hypothetical protein
MDKQKFAQEAPRIRRLDLSKATYSSFLSAPRSAPAWLRKLGDSNRFRSRGSPSATCAPETEESTSPITSNSSSNPQCEISPDSFRSYNKSENISPSENNHGSAVGTEEAAFSPIQTPLNFASETGNAFPSADRNADRDTSSGWVDVKVNMILRAAFAQQNVLKSHSSYL